MSSPADFWANKVDLLRRVRVPSPGTEKKSIEPTPAEASVPKKSGRSLVFKAPQKDSGAKSPAYTPTTFGSTSPDTLSTATSWADSVEEEEAEAAGHGYGARQKPQEYTFMASTVERQAERLKEVEATVNQQSQRIVEIHGEIKHQVTRIAQLEVALEEKSARVVELEATAIDQKARITTLISQVGIKARHAVQLEDELQKHATTIRELELQVAETVSIPDSESATEVEVEDLVKSTALPQPEPKASPVAVNENLDAPVDPTDTTAGAISVDPEKHPTSQDASPPQHESSTLSGAEFPALGTPTPVRDLRRSPFVTAENIKKMPLPPPARTLKLGIDPSKYQKKPMAGAGKFNFGSRRATEAPPNIDVNKDIRRMTKEEREPYGYGPTVQIMMGNETAAVLPKYIFMQVSSKALKHWTDNPSAQTIKFEAGSMTKDALSVQLEWITMHTHCNRVFSVSLKPENADRYNLELVRCARVLGLHPMYMGHFTRMYCQSVRDGPSKKLIALVEELAYTDDEPIFDCLANYLAMQHSKAAPEDLDSWDQQLARLPKLAKKMEDIQARKNFALGKSNTKGKADLPTTKAAEDLAATTVTTNVNIDPDTAWRATGPAYL